MTHVFEKRRNRLRAMKELSESYLPPEQVITCPGCGQEVARDLIDTLGIELPADTEPTAPTTREDASNA